MLIPFAKYEKTNFTDIEGHSFANGFSGLKNFRDFPETGSWCKIILLTKELNIWRVFSHVTNAHQAPLLKTCAFSIVEQADLVFGE